ncbi:Spectrin beta chain [Schistosoma japonicum]|nr:Spectrin beta chain [Schistosoma japonicum]
MVDSTKCWRESLAFAESFYRYYPNFIYFDQICCIENIQLRLEIIFKQANLHTLQSKIYTSQLAASHCLFKASNGFSLNDLEESWPTIIITEHNLNLALLNKLIRRRTYNLLIWHQEVEVVKFIGEMHSTEEDFLQLSNEKLYELKQFPCHNLIVNRNQITQSRNKHLALITDTETYINVKMHKLHKLFNAFISSVNTIQCDKYKTQWNTIKHTNTLLHGKYTSKLKQTKKLKDTNQTNSVDTYLNQFQINMNHQQFNDNLLRFFLQMNVMNSLKSIQLYKSYLDKKLAETSQWNTSVESVYCL